MVYDSEILDHLNEYTGGAISKAKLIKLLFIVRRFVSMPLSHPHFTMDSCIYSSLLVAYRNTNNLTLIILTRY